MRIPPMVKIFRSSFIALSGFCFVSCSGDFRGHKLDGKFDDCDKYPENTWEMFNCTINYEQNNQLSENEQVEYYELDVQETKDHKFIVLHDRGYVLNHNELNTLLNRKLLTQFVADENKMREEEEQLTVETVKIHELNQNQLLQLHRKESTEKSPVFISSLDKILHHAGKARSCLSNGLASKKIFIEIKKVHSELGRNKLIKLVSMYKSRGLNVDFLLLRNKWERLKGGKQKWLAELKAQHLYITFSGSDKIDLVSGNKLIHPYRLYNPYPQLFTSVSVSPSCKLNSETF